MPSLVLPPQGQDGHSAPLEPPAPDPAQALIRRLTPRLSVDEEATLAGRILSDYRAALQDRTEWESRLADWEDAYHGRLPDKDFPWTGCSNFHVPLTMMGVESYKPRLVAAVWDQQPVIQISPISGATEEQARLVEAILNWQAQNVLNLDEKVPESAHLFLSPGIVVAKTYWSVRRRWRKYVREFPLETPMTRITEALFGPDGLPRDLRQEGDDWVGTKAAPPGAGDPLQTVLRFSILDDALQVLVEEEQVESGPAIDLIEAPDVIAPAKGGTEPDQLPWIQHRLWLTEDDLRGKVALGRFDAGAVQAVLDSGIPKGDRATLDSARYHQVQDEAEGVEGSGPSSARRRQWEVLEDYRRYDIDGDGSPEEIITWVCPDASSHILGWDYLDNVYAHGRRPLRVGRFQPVPFRFLGLSFAEVVRGVQEEINAIHNQRVDYATIQNMPFGFKRASATLPPIQQRLRPGEFLDVDNPQQDIFIPRWQGTPAWGNQEEATLMQYFERLSGVSDLSIGRQPNRVGATRTARGTQTLLAEGGLRSKVAIQAFQRFWRGVFEDVLALDQEHLPPRQEFRITGRRPTVIKVNDRTEIRGRYRLRIVSGYEAQNRATAREDATMLMQALMNPALLQGGIVGARGIRRVAADLLRAFGKDPDLYLEDEAILRSPAEELMMFASGQYVSPVHGENIERHLQEHQQALADPQIPHDVQLLIARHIQETRQLELTMRMMQTMQAAGPRQQGPSPQPLNALQGETAPSLPPGQPPPNSQIPGGSRGLTS